MLFESQVLGMVVAYRIGIISKRYILSLRVTPHVP